MKKVKSSIYAEKLEQIPNVGPRTSRDFHRIGISKPKQLKGKDPYKLFVKLCQVTKTYHDPCTLDVFISAVRFMDGEEGKPWWNYSKERKMKFDQVLPLIKRLIK